MAIDSVLLDRAEHRREGWLRLYSWAPHCLSFGRHEPAARRYDAARIAALGLDVVRRPTGGRAVWHAGELTYAVAAPIAWLGSLREAYVAIHEMLRRALATLGADATLAQTTRTPGVGAGACFAQPAGGEVMVGGRKVIGSAQLRQEEALLQHGSILLENDQSVVGTVSVGSAPPDLAAPLSTLLGRSIERGDVATAVAGAATSSWTGDWDTITEPSDVLDAATLHTDRFRSRAWTWAR